MRKFVITGITVADKLQEKVKVQYTLNGVRKVSKRALYTRGDETYILFRGARISVQFDPTGRFVESAELDEIYFAKEKEDGVEDEFIVNIPNDNEIPEEDHEEWEEAPKVSKVDKTTLKGTVGINKSGIHAKYDEIKVYIEHDIPVYLYGPAGSGKNHALKTISEELGLDFYFTNSVQQEYKITGFIDGHGHYHETEFYKAFTKGGLFFLDELDGSIPEVLILLNAAIANRYMEFPNGRKIAHEEFRVVAAGNTLGNGADDQYTGRLQLDQSTLDRFAMISFDYDIEVERAITEGNEELINFIHDLRKQAKETGINATFSYRCLHMITQLEGKIPLFKLMGTVVVKGMDIDTLNTLKTTPDNKYSKALWLYKKKLTDNEI